MDEKFIIERQGKSYVLYAGLLDAAHRQGLTRIGTTILQLPTPANGNMAIIRAEVETAKGVFSGLGDAAPGNVGTMIVPHIIRMAETRGKARALRDATNSGAAPMEDFVDEGGSDVSPPVKEPAPPTATPQENAVTQGTVHAGGKTPPNPPPASHRTVNKGSVRAGGTTPSTPPPSQPATRDPRDALALLANDLARLTQRSLYQVYLAVAVKLGIRFTKTDALSDEDAVRMGKEIRTTLDALKTADAENAEHAAAH